MATPEPPSGSPAPTRLGSARALQRLAAAATPTAPASPRGRRSGKRLPPASHGRGPQGGAGRGPGAGARLETRVPRAALRARPRAAVRPHPAALRRADADALRRAPGLPRRLRGRAGPQPGGRAQPRAARGAGRGGGRLPRGARRLPQLPRRGQAARRGPFLRQAAGAGAAAGGGSRGPARQGPRPGGARPRAGPLVHPEGWRGRSPCLPGEFLHRRRPGAATGSPPGLGARGTWFCLRLQDRSLSIEKPSKGPWNLR